MNKIQKSAVVIAVAFGAPLMSATAALADSNPCVDVKASPAIPAKTHDVTVTDVPPVLATEGTPAVAAVTHQETVIDTAAVDAVPHVEHTEYLYQRTVQDESTVETSGWVLTSPGDGWVQVDSKTVIDTPEVNIPAVPAIDLPAITTVVHHNAVTHVVHHPAVTHQSTVVDTAAYDETVVDHAAYDETVIDTPAQAAVPGTPAVTHEEWRFQTRTQLFGSKEVKSVKGYNFVEGGTTTVKDANGHNQTVGGHWVKADAGTFYDIPDVIINIVWGSGGVPAQYLGTGNVNLSTYGGPNTTVQYKAVKVTTSAGYTDYGPFSGWSTTNPGADTDTRNTEERTVTDKAAVPAKDAVPAVTHVVHHNAVTHIVHHNAVTHQITVTDTAAFDETVTDTAAYDETVIVVPAVHIPGIPAVHIDAITHVEYRFQLTTPHSHVETSGWLLASPGEDWTQVDNRQVVDVVGSDAIPAVTHEITVTDHAAIPAVPGTPFIPAVTHVVTIVDSPAKPAVKAVECATVLPHTGSSGNDWGIAGVGAAAVVLGTGAVLFSRRRRGVHSA